jgi:hypothetical protein
MMGSVERGAWSVIRLSPLFNNPQNHRMPRPHRHAMHNELAEGLDNMSSVIFASCGRARVYEDEIVGGGGLLHGRLYRRQLIGHDGPACGQTAPLLDVGGQDEAVVFDDLARLAS